MSRPTIDMDPAMLAALVLHTVTIPISLADLEIDDDPEPAPKPVVQQVTQPLPQLDDDPATMLWDKKW